MRIARIDTGDRHNVMMWSPRPREATEKCNAFRSEDGHEPWRWTWSPSVQAAVLTPSATRTRVQVDYPLTSLLCPLCPCDDFSCQPIGDLALQGATVTEETVRRGGL